MGQKSLFAIAQKSLLLAKLVMFSQIVEIVQLIDMHYLVVYIVRELERKRSSLLETPSVGQRAGFSWKYQQ